LLEQGVGEEHGVEATVVEADHHGLGREGVAPGERRSDLCSGDGVHARCSQRDQVLAEALRGDDEAIVAVGAGTNAVVHEGHHPVAVIGCDGTRRGHGARRELGKLWRGDGDAHSVAQQPALGCEGGVRRKRSQRHRQCDDAGNGLTERAPHVAPTSSH
jgi:hypothetical protein